MIPQIKEINFPSYATLSSATITLNDMGARTISTQVKIEGSVIPDFSYDWEVEFEGHKYIHPLRKPQATKDNSSKYSTIDLTFQHYAIYQLQRYYFVELVSTEAGTAIADKYIASLALSVSDFVNAFNRVLNYYFNGEIRMELNPDLPIDPTRKFIGISYSLIWEVLQEFYNVYNVRWDIVKEDNTYVIKVGYDAKDITHTFEYGYEGGLLSIERQVQDQNIRNVLLGRGGNKNLPYRYFKNVDPQNPTFAADPDWIPELQNIYFNELRGKTFRDYIQGWKTNPNRDTKNGTLAIEPYDNARGESVSGWAYKLGHTDTKFNPVEYVKDDLSISEYGILQGAVTNEESIYPSIQNYTHETLGRIDEVVAVDKVESDDVEDSVIQSGIVYDFPTNKVVYTFGNNSQNHLQDSFSFEFPLAEREYGFFEAQLSIVDAYEERETWEILDLLTPSVSAAIVDLNTGGELPVDIYRVNEGYRFATRINLKGEYRFVCNFDFKLLQEITPPLTAIFAIEDCQIRVFKRKTYQEENNGEWGDTFNIWIKNIWGTNRTDYQSNEEYVKAVWEKVIGQNEAKVCFSSGMLAHEDYEFVIHSISYDNSATLNGVQSEWKLELVKSDAELEATGLYIPNSKSASAIAGDFFYFIDIDMPHQYVLWAEERLDAFKTDALMKSSDIKPKWVVKFDKLRFDEIKSELQTMTAGSILHLKDKRFINITHPIDLHITSMTYQWSAASMIPEIEVVLADSVEINKSVISEMQSDITTLSNKAVGISNVEAAIRNIGDRLFLRKDGMADTSISPTKFLGRISGENFSQGIVGGRDWGIYKDQNGFAVAEFDRIIARKDMTVNSMIINQLLAIGGRHIISAASMECVNVEELEDSYKCYFDQKGGSVANQFVVNDIAYCHISNPIGGESKYYKRVVIEAGLNFIRLSKTDKDGDGIPAIGDNIIQFGHKSDLERQSVIIISSLQGGSIKLYNGINDFNVEGKEYVGLGVNPTTNRAYLYCYGDMFFGDRNLENQYITFQIPEGKTEPEMFVNANVTLGADSTGLSNLQEFKELQEQIGASDVDYLKEVLPNTLDADGAVLSKLLAVKDDEDLVTAGIYGGGSEELNNEGFVDADKGALMLFAGANGIDNVENATTRIYEDGTIYANKIYANNGGEIAGFKISGTRIGSGDNENGMSLASDFVKFKSSDKSAMVGNGIPATTGISAVGEFVNSTQQSSIPNYGLIVEVTGGRNIRGFDNNIAFKGNGNVVSKGVVGSYNLVTANTSNSTAANVGAKSMPFTSSTIIMKTTSEGYITFPTKSEVQSQLGLGSSGYFSVRLTLISDASNGTNKCYLVGRGASRVQDSAEYPFMCEAGVGVRTDAIEHGQYDVSEWQLVYNGIYYAYRLMD